MTQLYGKTKFSIDEFHAAPAMAKWHARKKRIMHCCFTMQNATPQAIGEQLGIPTRIVKAILDQPKFKEEMAAAIKAEWTAVLPQLFHTILEMVQPEKPDGIRLRAAMWGIERSDMLQRDVLKQEPKKALNEDELNAMVEKYRTKRLKALNAKAIDATVVDNGGQALEGVRAQGGNDAAGPEVLGQQRGEDRREQPSLPGPVQACEVPVAGSADQALSVDLF